MNRVPVRSVDSLRIEMPRAKQYPGKVVINTRMNNRKMHMVANYKAGRRIMGIYSDAFDIFVSILAKRIKNKQQNVVVIQGPTGSGKSTLGYLLCQALAKKLNAKFDLQNDYIYSMDDLWAKLQSVEMCPINFIDEASLVVNSKRSMSKESIDIVNIFNTMRSLGLTTILCTPNISQIDKGIRTIHADYMLSCSSEDSSPLKNFGRGIFEIYKAVHYEFSQKSEPYWLLQAAGVFGKLSEKQDQEYQPIKRMAQQRLIDKMAERYNAKSNVDDEGEPA